MGAAKWAGLAGASQGLSGLGVAMFEDAKLRTLEDIRANNMKARDDRIIAAEAASDTRKFAHDETMAGREEQFRTGLLAQQQDYAKENMATEFGYNTQIAESSSRAKAQEMMARDLMEQANSMLQSGMYDINSPEVQELITKSNNLRAGGALENVDVAPRLTPEIMDKAKAYADQRVKESAGLLSSDKTDFAQFEGDRQKAWDHYYQQYLDNILGKKTPESSDDTTTDRSTELINRHKQVTGQN